MELKGFGAERLVGIECGETVRLWSSKFVWLEGCRDEWLYEIKVFGLEGVSG